MKIRKKGKKIVRRIAAEVAKDYGVNKGAAIQAMREEDGKKIGAILHEQ